MANGSKLVAHAPNAEAARHLSIALGQRFLQFSFLARGDDGTAVHADGPAWALKASERPALGAMQSWAEGYLACLAGN